MKDLLIVFAVLIPILTYGQVADNHASDTTLIQQDTVNPKGKKELAFYQGVIFMERLMYESAIRSFDEYMDLDSSTANAYLFRGISRYKLGQFLLAKNDFKKGSDLEPENSDHFMWWGKSAEGLEEWEEAKQQYKKVNKMKPGWVEAELRYGHCALESGDTITAKTQFSALQAKGIRSALLEYDLGRIAFAEGDTSTAMAWFKASLDVDNGRSPALLPMAEIYWKKRDTLQTLEYLNLYIDSVNHQNPDAFGFRAKVRLSKGDSLKALIDLNDAVFYAPDKIENYGLRAPLKARFGDYAGACEDASKYREAFPKEGEKLAAELNCR